MPDERSSTPGRRQLGSNLRRILAEKDIPQGEFATQLGVSRDTVVRYLRGEIDMPVSRLMRSAEILDVKPCHLLLEEAAA